MGDGARGPWAWDPEAVFAYFDTAAGVDDETVEDRINAVLTKAASASSLSGRDFMAMLRKTISGALEAMLREGMLVPAPDAPKGDVAVAAVDWACPSSRHCRGDVFDADGNCRHHSDEPQGASPHLTMDFLAVPDVGLIIQWWHNEDGSVWRLNPEPVFDRHVVANGEAARRVMAVVQEAFARKVPITQEDAQAFYELLKRCVHDLEAEGLIFPRREIARGNETKSLRGWRHGLLGLALRPAADGRGAYLDIHGLEQEYVVVESQRVAARFDDAVKRAVAQHGGKIPATEKGLEALLRPLEECLSALEAEGLLRPRGQEAHSPRPAEVLYTNHDLFEAVCREKKMWGLLLHTVSDDPFEVRKAAPYLSEEEALTLAFQHDLFLFFTSEEECYRAYGLTAGDDGPTKSNPYTGPANIYAYVCSPSGEGMTENT